MFYEKGTIPLTKYRDRSMSRIHIGMFSLGCALILMSASVAAQSAYLYPIPDIPQTSKSSVDKRRAMEVAQLTLDLRDVTLRSALESIRKASGMKLLYGDRVVPLDRKVSAQLRKVSVLEALEIVLKGTGVIAKPAEDGQIVLVKEEFGRQRDSTSKAAATGVIQGHVIDKSTKEPLAQAVISLQPTKNGTQTNVRGAYQITGLPPGDYIVTVRILGYQTLVRNVTIGASVNLTEDFALVSVASRLTEVVTTATGKQRRLEVGNDIVKIDPAEIMERAPARSVTDVLRFAQIPGVNVISASGEPGAPTKILMRGIGSISQSTDPAIIVDGIWIDSRASDSSIINRAYGSRSSSTKYTPSPLDNIDPSTIESMEIVRGPSAASLYGHEAANGVIVITTKRGKDGPTSWTYNFSKDWDSQVRAKHGNWYPFGTDELGNSFAGCELQAHYQMSCIQDSAINLNRFGYLLDETGPGSLQRHSLTVRGGNSKTLYSFTTSFSDNLGTRRTRPIDLARMRLLNIDLEPEIKTPGRAKDLKFSSSLLFNATRLININLVVNAYNSTLNQGEIGFGGDGQLPDSLKVLLGPSSHTVFVGGSNRTGASSSLAVQLVPDSWWNLRANLGADISERMDHGRDDSRICEAGVCEPRQGSPTTYTLKQRAITDKIVTARVAAGGAISTILDRVLTMSPLINFDAKRTINREVGSDLAQIPFGSQNGSGLGRGTIQQRDLITAGYSFSTAFKVLDRMYFDVGFRQDGGSAIQRTSSSKYPRLSTSWIVSEEKFFPQNRFVNLMVLRGVVGYGAVHPDAADLHGGYAYRYAGINEEEVLVADMITVGNRDLVPERSMEFEGGIDADLFGDRVQLGFTLSNKNLRNAIIARRLPVSAGSSVSGGGQSRKENISRVQNRSVEFVLNTRVIDNNSVLLSLGTSMSNINNVIRRLGNNAIHTTNTSTDRLVEGYQIGSVWMLPVLGYGDVDNNGYIDGTELILGDTTTYVGWNQPKFTASYNGTLAILRRSLSFSFSLDQQGPSVQQAKFRDNYGLMVVEAPLEAQALSLSSLRKGGLAMRVSNLRLNSASVNYTVPREIVKRFNSKLIMISLQGSNLALWTNYSGRDPMVNSTPVGHMITDDGFTLPIPRKYALNVRVEL